MNIAELINYLQQLADVIGPNAPVLVRDPNGSRRQPSGYIDDDPTSSYDFPRGQRPAAAVIL